MKSTFTFAKTICIFLFFTIFFLFAKISHSQPAAPPPKSPAVSITVDFDAKTVTGSFPYDQYFQITGKIPTAVAGQPASPTTTITHVYFQLASGRVIENADFQNIDDHLTINPK
jgi:hypothetical protein